MQPIVTEHARQRQAQRNLSPDDIEFVIEHGRYIHNGGALHIFLGKQDIPREKGVQRRFGRLEGTTLVMAEEEDKLILITAYRNRKGFKQLRTKRKYNLYS